MLDRAGRLHKGAERARGEYILFTDGDIIFKPGCLNRSVNFMRENKAFPDNINILEVLEFYFQCCSLESDTKMLARVAATFANSGINPFTNQIGPKYRLAIFPFEIENH